jgi:hypothetical protein
MVRELSAVPAWRKVWIGETVCTAIMIQHLAWRISSTGGKAIIATDMGSRCRTPGTQYVCSCRQIAGQSCQATNLIEYDRIIIHVCPRWLICHDSPLRRRGPVDDMEKVFCCLLCGHCDVDHLDGEFGLVTGSVGMVAGFALAELVVIRCHAGGDDVPGLMGYGRSLAEA